MKFKRIFYLSLCVLMMSSCSSGKEVFKNNSNISQAKNVSVDEKIKKTIGYLGLENEKVEKVTEDKISEIGNIEYKINGQSELIFKKDGTLKRMSRTSELDTSKSGVTLETSRKQEILNSIKNIIPNGFTVREEQDMLGGEGTKFIFSNDKNGIVNKYNVVIVTVENSTGKIISYKRVEEFTEDVLPKVKEDEAKTIADDYIKSKGLNVNMQSVKLEINKVGLSEENKPILLYIVTYNAGYEVWVNAISGKVEFLNSYK